VKWKSNDNQTLDIVQNTIPGLTIVNNYLTQAEHDYLLELALEERQFAARSSYSADAKDKKYDHLVATMQFIPSVDIYLLYKQIFDRMIHYHKLVPHAPKQLTMNYYEPHEGLAPHTDHPKIIKELVVGFSLASPCVMQFTHETTKQVVEYVLEPRSVMIQQGEARYKWQHGIENTKLQILMVCDCKFIVLQTFRTQGK
jgi:alkylated DNA repair dioxygenase AlkB